MQQESYTPIKQNKDILTEVAQRTAVPTEL